MNRRYYKTVGMALGVLLLAVAFSIAAHADIYGEYWRPIYPNYVATSYPAYGSFFSYIAPGYYQPIDTIIAPFYAGPYAAPWKYYSRPYGSSLYDVHYPPPYLPKYRTMGPIYYGRYGDPEEYYGFKRGPVLREYPPYPSVAGGVRTLAVAPIRLAWLSDQTLKVTWVGRMEPVNQVELHFLDQAGNVLGRRVVNLPFDAQLDAPYGATDLRVTVYYADGGVASSVTKLPYTG
jgi:hypothetical protein